MAKRLFDMEIDEGSFVNSPTNKLAKIVFFKRDGAEHCSNCGIGVKNPCEFCWAESVKKTTFFKRETEDSMNIPRGKSEKDAIWTKMQETFDVYQKRVNDAGYRAQGNQFAPQSRDKLFARWLGSSEGAALYAEYEAASDVATPINKSEQGPTNLKEFGWEKLEAIAKKHQERVGGSVEAAHATCARGNEAYGKIYSLIHDSWPLDEIDFSERISKSKADAISLFKAQILVEAAQAGI